MRRWLLLAGLVAAFPARAEMPLIEPIDFMVEWPDMVGRELVIRKGRVFGANDQFMLLKLPGGNVNLSPPWKDRDDLRHLFSHCTGILTGDACDVAVAGTVVEVLGGGPGLKGVDFFRPASP